MAKGKAKRARSPKPRATKGTKAAKSARERHRTPKAAALPGMEQVRDATLDKLCKRISDNTAGMNELRSDVEADKQAALDHMLAAGTKTYHHHGVELIVRGGAAKLSVRPYQGDTQATAPADDAGGEDAGE